MKRMTRLSMLVLAGFAATPATAATFCAENAVQLQAALAAADGNGQHDQIRIRAGTYDVSALDLTYNAAASESFDLDVSGGWSQFFDNPCGQQLSSSPWDTVLDGGGSHRVMQLFLDSDAGGDVTVRQLTFLGGYVDPGLGAGLSISYLGGTSGTVRIERNVFALNEADQQSGLAVQGGTLQKITNNLFVANQGGSRAAAYMATSGLFGVSFTNNTVVGQSHSNSGQPAVQFGAGRVFIANNNFWDNDGDDADAGATGDRFVYNNNYESLVLHGGEVLEDNIGIEPEYEGGLFDYTPVRGSPLVDAGREPEGAAPLWELTDLDLDGSARVVGVHVDIGAFENETIFADGFDPSGPFGR